MVLPGWCHQHPGLGCVRHGVCLSCTKNTSSLHSAPRAVLHGFVTRYCPGFVIWQDLFAIADIAHSEPLEYQTDGAGADQIPGVRNRHSGCFARSFAVTG